MSSQLAIHTAKTVRSMTVGLVSSIDESYFDIQPPQFNNTIRWNLGHIIASTDSLAFQRITGASKLPAGFAELFKGGTRPSDWNETPPSKTELIQLLNAQLDDLIATFSNRLDEKLSSPLQIRNFTFETVEEVINFASVHETMHFSTISCLLKVVTYPK